MRKFLNKLCGRVEEFLDFGGVTKDIVLLFISGTAVVLSLIFGKTGIRLPLTLHGFPSSCAAYRSCRKP